MTSLHLIRRLLPIVICAWCGVPALVVAATDSEHPAQSLGVSNRQPSLLDSPNAEGDDFTAASGRRLPEQQWAALSPEQRDELRNQVREHRQRSRDERRYDAEAPRQGANEGRQQRLSPDQREEFRQWMRERRGGERSGGGRGPP